MSVFAKPLLAGLLSSTFRSLGPKPIAIPPAPVLAPAVVQRLTVGGDSWTAGNEQKISRSGAASPVESDRWDFQLAGHLTADLGDPFVNDTSPSGAKAAPRVINAGYGGQTSQTIVANLTNIVTSTPDRANDAFIGGLGRNNVADSVTIIAKAGESLALFPHHRKLLWEPYGAVGASASGLALPGWVHARLVQNDYRRTKRRYYFEFGRHWRGMSPFGSSGSVTDNDAVAASAVPATLFASAATAQDHPNHVAAPLMAAGFRQVTRAMFNRDVCVLDQSIPDVPFNMAAGQTIDVYFKGHITHCSISQDDATAPGLFTIAMKPGSNDTAELTRTGVSPGQISRILKLRVTATGVDTSGATKTHTGEVRIMPSVVGSGVTSPVGATLQRDPNPTATSRRWPFMCTRHETARAHNNIHANNAKITFVANLRFDEDGTAQTIRYGGSSVGLQVLRTAANKLQVIARDSSGAQIFSLTGTVNFTSATGLFWLAVSIDLVTAAAHIWTWTAAAGDQSVGAPVLAANNGLLNLALLHYWFGTSANNRPEFKGGVRLLFESFGAFHNFGLAAERRRFWNTDGTPVDRGGDGSLGLTKAPEYEFRGAPGDWVMGKNFGTLGDVGWNDNWLLGCTGSSDPLPL